MNNKTPPALRKFQGFRCSGRGNLGQRPALFFIIPQVHFHFPSVSDTLCLVALKLITVQEETFRTRALWQFNGPPPKLRATWSGK